MLAALGAQTILAAVVGDDEEGRTVGELLDNLEINRRLVLAVDDRVTTVKQRLLGRAQHRYPHQMMRVDRESVAPISAATVDLLLAGIARCMDEVDLVLVSDYDKGVCKGDMFPRLIELARAAGVPRAGRSGQGRRLPPLRRLHLHHAQSGRGRPGPGHSHHDAAGGPGRRPQTPGLRRAIGHRHLGSRRHGLGRSRRPRASSFPPGRGRSATSPAPATWSSRCWATCWRPARTRRRPSKWPTWPAAWKSNDWASCRSPAATFSTSWPTARPSGQQDPADGTASAHARAAAAGRQADRDDQRLLRPPAPRPRGLAGRGPQAGRLPAGGRQQRPQRAGNQGSRAAR